jgi:hypothetical protein
MTIPHFRPDDELSALLHAALGAIKVRNAYVPVVATNNVPPATFRKSLLSIFYACPFKILSSSLLMGYPAK